MSEFPTLEKRFDNPVAERVEKRGISLPAAANITEEDVEFVCKTLIESLQ
jgi:perosamine synthetase